MMTSTSYHQKMRSLLSLLGTLVTLLFVQDSLVIVVILLALWLLAFYPISRTETAMFVTAAVFFLGQNYAVLQAGGFYFKHREILLMPYYEPLLWGFYFLHIKRFTCDPYDGVHLELKSVFGFGITVLAFTLFSTNTTLLFISTLISTSLLCLFFHQVYDVYHAGYALLLGVIIEVFGVSTGLWWYPEPDILGMPYWFMTMWLSVGWLGRRFLWPLAVWITRTV
jgi:hypothetical protein